ncbi:MAG: nucleotidyltransferase family protein [Sphingobacteriales bacterium]|nr:nucleotidyltransferase family protein [Sphingobacteriales bacterium]
MIFEPDFIDFIDLLNKHQVEYMVVGAHALAFHGRPRHTGDLDIWIRPSVENASKLVDTINDFGFGSLGLKVEDFIKENYVTQLGYPPLRIDILNSISGVFFEEAYVHRINGEIEGMPISFISVQDFIENKKASGRTKDLSDLELLNKSKKK